MTLTKKKSLPLETISLLDLVSGIIILKEGKDTFREEKLIGAFMDASKNEEALAKRLQMAKPQEALQIPFMALRMSYRLGYTIDYQFQQMGDKTRGRETNRLKEEYGENFLEELEPFSKEVWRAYERRQKRR